MSRNNRFIFRNLTKEMIEAVNKFKFPGEAKGQTVRTKEN